MNNIVVYAKFLSERATLLVEYEFENEYEGDIEIMSVRLIRKVANGHQIYARADGTRRAGPIYEAAWLHGYHGVEFILSPHQLSLIEDMVKGSLHGPRISIPEDQIVYAEVK